MFGCPAPNEAYYCGFERQTLKYGIFFTKKMTEVPKAISYAPLRKDTEHIVQKKDPFGEDL